MEIEAKRDEFFMRAALNEARAALERGEVPIGAVVVTGGSSSPAASAGAAGKCSEPSRGPVGLAGGTITGRGHNLVETLIDATAHAEMQAITAASSALGGKYLTDCTLYVTVEPCVMCAGAMAWAQLGRLVYGASDPKRGFSLYGADGRGGLLHPRTEVLSGILEEECAAMMTDFFKKLRG